MSTTKKHALPALAKIALALTLTSVVALTGCNHIQVLLGTRVFLAKTPVNAMEVALPKNPAIAPGEKSALVATFQQPDGKVLVTAGKGKGKVMWKELVVTPTVVTVNKNGVLFLPYDPRISDGKLGHVTVTVPSHPDLHADLDIPLRYNYPFKANYSGADGSNGQDGSNGTDGSSGSAGSTDPDTPSPGGNGGNGSNGGDGGDGGDGGNAPPVQVQMTMHPGGKLVEMAVTAPGRKEHFYLVDPNGGTLSVSANGGSGGAGGRGGRGGSGGAGGIGTPNGSSGMDGSAGHDGSSGSDGRAGTITVLYDPQAKPFLSILQLSNHGAPAPSFTEQPIAPLW